MPADNNTGEPRLRPASSPRAIAWSLSLFLATAATITWAVIPTLEAHPLLRVALFATLGFSMLGLVFLFPQTTDRTARRLILLTAILLRLILLPAPVSDDVNRYLWEGQLVASGENPYTAPADDPRWQDRRDATWQAMNHRDRPTAYPPGIQWIMAATVTIHSSLFSFKILSLIGDLATLLLLFVLLRENAAPIRWAGLYAFNPVVLIAFAAEAHFDSLMTAALLAALLAASRNQKSAWPWLALAIQIKLIALVLLPLFLISAKKTIRVHPRPFAEGFRAFLFGHLRFTPIVVQILLFLSILILPALPFASALPELAAALRTFAGSGDFNAPLFTLFAAFGIPLETTRLLCLAAFALSAAAITIARRKGLPLIDSVLWMLGALLACSPIVHFWYLAWLLPLAALRPSFAWTTLSITIAGYFFAWKNQATLGWWGFGHSVAAAIWIPWLLAAIAQHRHLPAKWLGRPAPVRPGGVPPPGISIIIPALKPSPELKRLIQNLRNQTPASTEIIISTCDPNFPEISDTRNIQAPRGRGNQIAAGIATTSAPWILIAHADSQPPPRFHETLRRAATIHPEASLIISGQRFTPSTFGTLLIEALNELRVVFGGVAFGDQTMLIRRSALEASGGFPAQPLMEDVEASLRLATQGKVIYLGHEWTLSAKKWSSGFFKRFLLVIRLVASYQLARLRSPQHAAALSEKMYREYYPPGN